MLPVVPRVVVGPVAPVAIRLHVLLSSCKHYHRAQAIEFGWQYVGKTEEAAFNDIVTFISQQLARTNDPRRLPFKDLDVKTTAAWAMSSDAGVEIIEVPGYRVTIQKLRAQDWPRPLRPSVHPETCKNSR